MLKTIFLICTLPIFLNGEITEQQTISNTSTVITESKRTFADLNKSEKAEFIKHVIETGDCEWKGIKLYGKVQFVESFPDINVEFVSSFPDKCGKWQEVSSFPDFKIQVVSSFPDIKVKKVTSFPGMN